MKTPSLFSVCNLLGNNQAEGKLTTAISLEIKSVEVLSGIPRNEESVLVRILGSVWYEILNFVLRKVSSKATGTSS